MKIVMTEEINDSVYRSEDGYQLAREQGLTPSGNAINNRWVFRDPGGEWIDYDQYRNDLAEWHGLELVNLHS